jgi:hypothetical protein
MRVLYHYDERFKVGAIRASTKQQPNYLIGELTHTSKETISTERDGLVMSILLIEPILDRYVAQAKRREKDWSPKEVEALLLKLRKEILDCLK